MIKSNKIFIVNFVFLPLVIGCFIYFVWRNDSLNMFHWFQFIGMGSTITYLRELFNPFLTDVPRWIIYSLPGGLWIFSYICLMGFIWEKVSNRIFIFWFTIGLAISVGSEIFQSIQFLEGTFSVLDLVTYFIAIIISFALIKTRERIKNEIITKC